MDFDFPAEKKLADFSNKKIMFYFEFYKEWSILNIIIGIIENIIVGCVWIKYYGAYMLNMSCAKKFARIFRGRTVGVRNPLNSKRLVYFPFDPSWFLFCCYQTHPMNCSSKHLFLWKKVPSWENDLFLWNNHLPGRKRNRNENFLFFLIV